jgi:hypothetical protein
MVSTNSSPPIAMPVQVPHGHVVQQIVDESGTLRHVILSPQHPPLVPLPPHFVSYPGLPYLTLFFFAGAFMAEPLRRVNRLAWCQGFLFDVTHLIYAEQHFVNSRFN